MKNHTLRGVHLLASLLFGLFLISGTARSELTIEVTTQAGKQIPIAIVPFRAESTLPQSVSTVVGADLARSGLFKLVETAGVNPLPSEPSEINYAEWRGRGADALVIGQVAPSPEGKLDIRFRLMDAARQVQITGAAYNVTPAQLRATAHKIADAIYEALTGDKGVFSTRIAYVVKKGRRYELQVADADGFNAQPVVASDEPIISPAWSPDGTRLAYVSFEQKKAMVVVQNLTTGSRKIVANFKGSNSAPAWSPDARRLAVTLTKDGSSQLYLIPADGGNPERITHSAGIDTEPVFSPDSRWIAFTSDRGGSPQIYRMPAGGGSAQRLTFEGSYNVSPDWSPDGKKIAYIKREAGRLRVAVLELDTGQVQTLTENDLDKSPSFAPNSKVILFSTQVGGRGVLSMVSSDGRVKQRLTTQSGDVQEPAWGPLSNGR